ncbi:uncharacterized protein LOC113768224 isoform X2 [Coffea eugenioides]|uniref:uncharacterized protein LOC113768224 isoform X2 n=1 Tax=Coffea eugenioides TaxID=49369 RepID=UPI000F6050E3|nr:uncharacterized protein LOC113768224 isoform X2 [Coffea eugenioides]
MTMPATASSPRIVVVHGSTAYTTTAAKGNNDSSRKHRVVNISSPFFSFAVDYSRNSRGPHPHRLIGFRLHCSDSGNSSSSSPSSSSTPNPPARGFGPKPSPPLSTTSKDKKPTRMRMDDSKSSVPPIRKSSSNRSNNIPNQAPLLSSQSDGRSGNIPMDFQFEERLEAVKSFRSALQQKQAEEEEQYGAIDYETPTVPTSNAVGLGTKIGAAVTALIFGLVFAFGDFLPSEKITPTEEATTVVEKFSAKERESLKRLQQFEQTLSISQDNPIALEGAAVTLAELGEYDRAASLLEDLTKKKPSDPDVFRLLGEVKYELKDYEGSARAYRNSAMVSKTIDFEVTRGLTNALLAAKKPGEAVQMLLPIREMLNNEKNVHNNFEAESSIVEKSSQLDPIQVDLLLGKAYSDWGHVSDAVAVYDQIISSHPDDFRGYLAKGIILKENGNAGGSERMFMQARFFAPEKAKALVDKYSR